MNDLQEFMFDKDEYPVIDLATATESFAKISFVNRKIKEIEEVADKQIELINAWKLAEVKKFEGKKEYYENRVTTYYLTEKNKNEKFKLSTPYGKVTTRKTSKWVYADETSIKNQLRALGLNDLVRVKEEINKNELKKIYIAVDGKAINTATGEVLENLTIEEVETISIKTDDTLKIGVE